jgi:hypothetical protein
MLAAADGCVAMYVSTHIPARHHSAGQADTAFRAYSGKAKAYQRAAAAGNTAALFRNQMCVLSSPEEHLEGDARCCVAVRLHFYVFLGLNGLVQPTRVPARRLYMLFTS